MVCTALSLQGVNIVKVSRSFAFIFVFLLRFYSYSILLQCWFSADHELLPSVSKPQFYNLKIRM